MSIRFSTLFTAQYCLELLSSEDGIQNAVKWCKDTRIEHIYIESFRSAVLVPKGHLVMLRDRFKAEGFQVSGCITTTKLGKTSTGYNMVSCYTDDPTRKQLQDIFEYTASMFDLIMIDDFLFTLCECPECTAAKGDKSWSQYRCELMGDVSRINILEASRKVNPNVKIIIKYPQWYDQLHERGYDVDQQTKDYDLIWVGTETRDFDDVKWGGTPQYEAYFNMRWLGGIGGSKTGGGWFDPYGTTEDTYLEQAIQTVLGGAEEVFLFNYGSLLKDTGPQNVEKLRKEQDGLFRLAELTQGKAVYGVLTPKPMNSHAEDEYFIYSFSGMMGMPLVHTASLDINTPSAFLPVQNYKDAGLRKFLEDMISMHKPLLITRGLADKIKDWNVLDSDCIRVLETGKKPSIIYNLDENELNEIRKHLLQPMGIKFKGPNKVAFYVFGDDTEVIENFNDTEISVTLEIPERLSSGERTVGLVIPAASQVKLAAEENGVYKITIPPRTMALLNAAT